MFVCQACEKKHLSDAGKSWPFPASYGPCELCDKADTCKDVPSGMDWAWTPTQQEEPDAD